jgi:hypothetical protein
MTIKNGTTFIFRLGLLLLCLVTPQLALAQDPPKPADPAPAPDPDKVTLNFFKGTEIGGLVDGYYLWNSNKTGPAYHAFDTKHNNFDLSMAEVWLAKAPAMDSPIGYKVRMTFGSAADLMASSSLRTPPDTSYANESPYKNVEEAFGSYLAPVGKGLQIDFGKFVTNAGAEVIEAKDNWNYSRSLLFQLGIPLYHAGLRVTYSPSDKVTLMTGVVNGWNDVGDNNTGKSIMASITYKPTGSVSIIENYIGGPEQPGNSTDWRTLSDTVLSYTVNPSLSLMLNYDYTRDTVSTTVNTTQGVALYLKYQANKWFAISPRYEYFNDAQGAPWATGAVQHLQDATITLELKPADNFIWRVEYRGDFSSGAPYVNISNAPKTSQNMLTLGFLYSFSSKS